MEQIDVLAICGSTREESLNRALLRAALDLAGDRFKVEVWDDYAHLPRVDATRGQPFPATVSALRERVSAANVLLLVTPELNRSIPGGLKDVVDWLSILAPPRPLVGKPVALMSASPQRFGGGFAQLQLAEFLHRAGAEVITDLNVAIGSAHSYLDHEGALVGEDPLREISELWQRVLGRVGDAHQLAST
jgi:chromate reductase